MDDLRRRFAALDALAVPDLRAEIDRRAADPAPGNMTRVVADRTIQRPAGSSGPGAWGQRRAPVPVKLGVALLLLTLIVSVAVGAGWWLRSTVVTPTLPPTSAPSTLTVAPERFVFYAVFDEVLWAGSVWVVKADGQGAHQLRDGAGLGGLSPDGRHLVHGTVVYDVVGPEPSLANPQILDCGSPDCTFGGLSFSPDGARVAFVSATNFTAPPGSDANYGRSVIAILDIATGRVTELESTAVDWPDGVNERPSWSPDGRRLTFTRRNIWTSWPPRPGQFEGRELFVANQDGSDLRQLVPSNLSPGGGSWTADGSRIVFTSYIEWRGLDPLTGETDYLRVDRDVYSVRADGTDRRRLTNDTAGMREQRDEQVLGATASGWTHDGRIVLTRHLDDGSIELWVMDADGGNQQRLDAGDLASLTAAGCVVCPYPPDSQGSRAGTFLAYWQPVPASQP